MKNWYSRAVVAAVLLLLEGSTPIRPEIESDIVEETFIPKIARSSGVLSISVSSDGNTFVSGCEDKTARIWSLNNRNFLTLSENTSPVTSVSFSPLGDKILTKGDGDTATLWDSNGRKLLSTHSSEGWIQAVLFAPDGKSFYTASDDGKIYQWDLTGKLVYRYVFHTDAITSIDASKDGKFLVAGSDDGKVSIWQVKGKLLKEMEGHGASVSAVAISPDNSIFASGGLDNKAILWNMKGEKIREFLGHSSSLSSIAFSPNGKLIATASQDRTARIWNLSGEKVAELEGHTEDLTDIKFLHKGEILITSSTDGSHIFWNLKGRRLGNVILTERGKVVFTEDGRFEYDDSHSADSIEFEDKISGQVVNIDQFFDRLYTPNLYSELLSEVNGAKPQKNIAELYKESPAPSVLLTIATTPRPKEQKIDLEIKSCDTGGGVKELLLYHNGSLIDLEKIRGIKIQNEGKCTTQKISASLISGANTFQAVAKSQLGMAAYSKNLNIDSDKVSGPIPKPALHIVVIGIDQYKNTDLNLKYAVADAKAIRDSIREKAVDLFSATYVYEAFDKDASKSGIERVFALAAEKARPEDVAVIYIAGHGLSEERTYYFLPQENPGNNIQAIQSGLSQQELIKLVSRIDATKKFVMIDTCQSGGDWLVTMRGGSEDQAALGIFAKTAGVWVVAASLKKQYAWESIITGHGLLTTSILEAFEGKAGKAKTMSVGELIPYINRRVPEIAKEYFKKEQYPYTAQHGQDFPIATVK
ncbi:caspase domain protein [Leptospira fainei serovar Hurstbridge str. BUT 6]|uniref:Caspase domain protein n=1 Tax=Leptospira fainei serovar Hurstbridge str. BUT 6 TaxID=1193011 RepID=S3UVK1_9LEPT|nr:caspase family protein [Leptospira fainei]EPG73288.1 caspase domain protein [Leptospira fainei serovar Hurstbridge str. BUT 6]